jgi:hypothetical protein
LGFPFDPWTIQKNVDWFDCSVIPSPFTLTNKRSGTSQKQVRMFYQWKTFLQIIYREKLRKIFRTRREGTEIKKKNVFPTF